MNWEQEGTVPVGVPFDAFYPLRWVAHKNYSLNIEATIMWDATASLSLSKIHLLISPSFPPNGPNPS